ncbi:hypothetical protein AB6A40_004286 [Gnathostoma spinigerum]|uniref:Bestrophin homolog n=1 Tax=Gnathostoma spinigerum TaxID=75299 RepID=A0ABD6EE76_9BILA
MTITYTLEVSHARFWGFSKLLIKWRGSVYRLLYREAIVFIAAYYIVAAVYRYALPSVIQRSFEQLALACDGFTSVVPITFLMGFFVSLVAQRWWDQYNSIPWPDRAAIMISAYVHGNDERGRQIRRTLVRYLNQLFVLTFQSTSPVIKKRFPTIEHLVSAGLMTEDELHELEQIVAPHGNWWVPAQWFGQLIMVARKEGRIYDDLHLKSIVDEMLAFRTACGTIWSYDWISVPLVYTQVVTIAVYSFFASCLFSRQYLIEGGGPSNRYEVKYYVPLFTIFQFLFYVGWLKVAESMICPFGEDDDDFDMNWIVDRNVQVTHLIVDTMNGRCPKLSRDMFWDTVEPEVPYTQAAAQHKTEPFFGSTTAMNIPTRQAEWDIPSDLPAINEEEQVTDRKNKGTLWSRFNFGGVMDRADSGFVKGDSASSCSVEIADEAEDGQEGEYSGGSDNESIGSRQIEKKLQNSGLRGLIRGYSRQAIGSKQSLSSRISKLTHNTSDNRSPVVPKRSRQMSLPTWRSWVPSNSEITAENSDRNNALCPQEQTMGISSSALPEAVVEEPELEQDQTSKSSKKSRMNESVLLDPEQLTTGRRSENLKRKSPLNSQEKESLKTQEISSPKEVSSTVTAKEGEDVQSKDVED